MNKEKFDRNKPYANIGEIGKNEELDENRMAFVNSTINFVASNAKEYNQSILEELISQYGEDEGKRRFEILKQESKERSQMFKEIEVEPENKISGRRR